MLSKTWLEDIKIYAIFVSYNCNNFSMFSFPTFTFCSFCWSLNFFFLFFQFPKFVSGIKTSSFPGIYTVQSVVSQNEWERSRTSEKQERRVSENCKEKKMMFWSELNSFISRKVISKWINSERRGKVGNLMGWEQ